MIQRLVAYKPICDAHFAVGRTLMCLMLVIWSSAGVNGQNPGGPSSSGAGSAMRVTHVLGFEGIANNANGDLSVQKDVLQFHRADGSGAQISIGSIQDVLVGVQDKQVGGLPLTLGRAATPYGGGRVIALFSHKKYDTVTLEYLDSNGGLHGAIFQLDKGQGEVLKSELIAGGAHERTRELKNESK